MSIARSLSSRCLRQIRAARPALRSSRPARRGYASASETAHKAKETAKHGLTSEMPWLITAIGVTIPGTYLILNSGKVQNPLNYPLPGSHHHGGEHEDEEHEEDAEEAGEEAEKTESEEQPEGQEDEKKDEEGEQQDEDKAEQDKAEQKEDSESEGAVKDDSNTQDNSNKPGAKEGKGLSEVPDDNTLSRKTADGQTAKFDEKQELESDSDSKVIHYPDAKGGAKRRIESPYGNKLGEEDKTHDGDVEDAASPSKTPVPGSTSAKQAGLSNTDTKHSTKIEEMDSKSKKGMGGPETAKAQGTVDPNQPVR